MWHLGVSCNYSNVDIVLRMLHQAPVYTRAGQLTQLSLLNLAVRYQPIIRIVANMGMRAGCVIKPANPVTTTSSHLPCYIHSSS